MTFQFQAPAQEEPVSRLGGDCFHFGPPCAGAHVRARACAPGSHGRRGSLQHRRLQRFSGDHDQSRPRERDLCPALIERADHTRSVKCGTRPDVRTLRPTSPAEFLGDLARPARRPPNAGRRPELCTWYTPGGIPSRAPAGSGTAGSGGPLQSARRTKTDVVVTVVGLIVVANRGPAVVRLIVPRAATQNAASTAIALVESDCSKQGLAPLHARTLTRMA